MRYKLTNADIEEFRRAVRDVAPLGHDAAPQHPVKPDVSPTRTRRAAAREQTGAGASAQVSPAARTGGNAANHARKPARHSRSPTTAVPSGYRRSGAQESEYCRSGVQDNVFRKLKRGQFPIENEIDLHGYIIAAAETELRRFLESGRRANEQGCVLVIHGKGTRSAPDRPTIREMVREQLKRHVEVLAYCPERLKNGAVNDGASYVLLKSRAQGRRPR